SKIRGSLPAQQSPRGIEQAGQQEWNGGEKGPVVAQEIAEADGKAALRIRVQANDELGEQALALQCARSDQTGIVIRFTFPGDGRAAAGVPVPFAAAADRRGQQ